MKTKAAIAQLVEHFIRNEKVVGSSPTRGSKKNDMSAQTYRFFVEMWIFTMILTACDK